MCAILKTLKYSENPNRLQHGGSSKTMLVAPGVGFEPTRPREATSYMVLAS
jgi:hypothetical protein